MRLIDADVLKQHIDKLPALPDGNFAGNHSALKALINMQPTIEPEQRWIPCSERLPEESGRYLVSVLDGVGRRTTVAPYQPRYKAWTMTGRMAYWKVIAWMPLPAQYIPEGDDKHEG